MKTKTLLYSFVIFAFLSGCNVSHDMSFEKWQKSCFDASFSIPIEPNTALSPGQEFSMAIPTGKKVILTDIYIENLGGGSSQCLILEQRLSNSYEVKYVFNTLSTQITSLNYTIGLRLGDKQPINGKIVIRNDEGSKANILPRINGIIVE